METQESMDPGNRSSAEIERDLETHRARVEEDLAQLQNRLSPGQLMDQVFDYAKNGSGAEFTRNLGRGLRDNPLPVALIGMGVAWMMFSGAKSNANVSNANVSADQEWDYDRGRSLNMGDSQAGRNTVGGASDSEEENNGPGVLEKAGEMVANAKESATETFRSGTDNAARQGRDAKYRAQEIAGQASEKAGEVSRRVQRRFSDTLQEQPLILGALGVAVGTAIGAALPATSREDRMMGSARDKLKNRAEAAGTEQLDKAKRTAESALAAAKDEAEKKYN